MERQPLAGMEKGCQHIWLDGCLVPDSLCPWGQADVSGNVMVKHGTVLSVYSVSRVLGNKTQCAWIAFNPGEMRRK